MPCLYATYCCPHKKNIKTTTKPGNKQNTKHVLAWASLLESQPLPAALRLHVWTRRCPHTCSKCTPLVTNGSGTVKGAGLSWYPSGCFKSLLVSLVYTSMFRTPSICAKKKKKRPAKRARHPNNTHMHAIGWLRALCTKSGLAVCTQPRHTFTKTTLGTHS